MAENTSGQLDQPEPLTFAVFADVQFANRPDNGPRRYREALAKLQDAVATINELDPAFVVNLGDMIDIGAELEANFDKVISAMNGFEPPLYHVVGNHCLEAGRDAYISRTGLKQFYYDFEVRGWRFVVLDGNDISTRDLPEDSPQYKAAEQYINQNPLNRPWNGAIGTEQMLWLENVLTEADLKKQPVIILSHIPVHPEAAGHEMVLWNFLDVIKTIQTHNAVKAFFAGHHHPGGYAVDHGVHHVVFPAICDAPKDSNAFAIVTISNDTITIKGFGTVPKRSLQLRK